jgi:hypothetical protein
MVEQHFQVRGKTPGHQHGRYTPVFGDAAAKTYISVQKFQTGFVPQKGIEDYD